MAVRTFTLDDDPLQVITDLNAAFDGTTETDLNAGKIDGKIVSENDVAGTIVVRRASDGKIVGDLAGNADTATIADSADEVDWENITNKPIIRTYGCQLFTSSGTFVVPEGVTTVYVSMCGGGGGGGRAGVTGQGVIIMGGAGGGAACYYKKDVTVTPGQIIPITIGLGGAMATAGGTTSFGALLSAPGGGGGTNAGSSPGTPGASGGFGGQYGDPIYGRGGDSLFGSGGPGGTNSGIAARPGSGYGSGGGAGNAASGSPGYQGGNGAPGMCLVEW